MALLPQSGGSGICGSVPTGGPAYLYSGGADPGSPSYDLANSLGNCIEACAPPVVTRSERQQQGGAKGWEGGGRRLLWIPAPDCIPLQTQVLPDARGAAAPPAELPPAPRLPAAAAAAGLAGTNLYDLAQQNGATAWDTAATNPELNPSAVSIPCYADPASYLGGDAAYMQSAWGSPAADAAAVTTAEPGAACAGSFRGTAWSVDLRWEQALALVVITPTSSGVSGATIGVSSTVGGPSEPCQSNVQVAAGEPVPLACAATGRFLGIAGAALGLCSVEVYPASASASVNKLVTYTTGASPPLSSLIYIADGTGVTAAGNGGGAPTLILDLTFQTAMGGEEERGSWRGGAYMCCWGRWPLVLQLGGAHHRRTLQRAGEGRPALRASPPPL